MKKNMTILGSVVVIICIAVAVKQLTRENNHKALQVMMKSEPTTMNPVVTTDIYSEQVQDQIYASFYRYQGNKLVPDMAESMVEPTQNNTVYTFKIRPQAKWSNGDSVTATDFVTAIQKMADPKSKSQASADSIAVIKNYKEVHTGKQAPDTIGAKALDKKTVQITLAQPVPWFDELATKIKPVNTKKYQDWGNKYGTSSNYMVTNGAYKMSGWTGTNTNFSLMKNTNYWRAKQVKIDEIKTRVIKTPMTVAGEFKNKRLDIAQLSDNYIAEYQKSSEYHAVPQASSKGIYFNETSPKTDNEHLRKAFSFLIDRNEITKNVMKDGSIAQSNAVPRGIMKNPDTDKDFTTDAGVQFQVNTEKAKSEWAEYQKEIGKANVTLTIIFDDDMTSKSIGEYIQYAAEHSLDGLTIETKYEPHNQVVSDVLKQNFDLVNIGLSVDVADASYPLKIGQTGYGLNFSKISDSNFDDMLNKANDLVTNPVARYQILQRANHYFTSEKAYMIPIYQPITANVVAKRVGGFDANAFHSAPYQDMYWK